MDMDDMSDGTTVYEQYAFHFLYILAGAAVAVALCSWSFRLSTLLRTRAKRRNSHAPARTTLYFTIVSTFREISYIHFHVPGINLPNLGTIIFLLAYTVVLLSCLLSNVWAPIPIFWEALAMRAAYLSVAQLSLLILLAMKKNLLAVLFNSSHERLIIYHQFIGICLLMTISLHMGYFLKEWLYYDVWKSQWESMGMSMLRWGFAAWGILLLTVFTSVIGFRKRMYDGWISLHFVLMLAFFIMVILHLDPPYRIWAYIPLAFWLLDRLWRLANKLRLNASMRTLSLTQAATIVEPLQGDVVRLTILNFALKRLPGQYIYLSVLKLGLNSHPFTIISEPHNPDIVLLVKAKAGLTKRLLTAGSDYLPPDKLKLTCTIEGPYGGCHTPFQAFDSAVLISGGTGGTFTLSLLQDLVATPGCCRYIRYIWAIRAECHLAWFSDVLENCKQTALQNNVKLDIDVHVTRDTNITTGDARAAGPACRSSKCRCQSSCSEKSTRTSSSQLSDDDRVLIERPRCCCATSSDAKGLKSWITHAGRPDWYSGISSVVQKAAGETGIAVCGPSRLTHEVQNIVVRISDERAVKKGSGAEAIYLHVESQS